MKNISLLFIFLFSLSIFANNSTELPINGSISGKVIDANTKETIAYASVVIKNAKDELISGVITDEEGNFIVKKLTEGQYILEVQYMGFKTYTKKFAISKSNPTIHLGTILFEEDAESMDEIVVQGEVSTIQQKVDRKIINVGKDLVSAGATASEIMNNISSVSVDNDGNISLRGNQNVRVLVDGKPTNIDPAQLLKQIPSSSIKSVELITNPSAKYNPEGMSGMINIVLKKNTNLGFNGSLNTGITFGEDPKYNGSINMNYKTGKVNFFVNYGYNAGIRNRHGYVNRFDTNSESNFIFNSKNKSHLIKTGFDIYLNKKNTLSIYTNQNIFNGLKTSKSDITFLDNSLPDFNQRANPEKDNRAQTYNLDYKLDFDKEGHNIELEVNYNINNNQEDTTFKELNNPNDLTYNYTDDIDNDRKNTIINLDYVNPLEKDTKLELGLESRTRRTDNKRITTQFEMPNTFYEYDQDIYSFYATYSKKINKLSMQIGTRLESYTVNASLDNTSIYKDDYITVYPSAFFTYNPTEKNQYQLSYSRRVDRPSLSQVNPIREWSTPLITSVGNPELKPQFTNSLEVNYTRKLKKGSLTTGVFYRNITDNINRSISLDPLDPNKVILSHINSDHNNAFGFEISSNYKFAKWWSVNTGLDVYTMKERGVINGDNTEITNTNFNFRASNNFKVNKKLRLSLFGMYRGSHQNLQYNIDKMWKIDTGLRYTILKGKGSISARVSDIFNTMHFEFTAQNTLDQKGEFFWESQTAYIGFNYRFGNGKNKNRQRKQRNNNEKQGSGGF